MSAEETLPARAPAVKDKARLVAIGLVLGMLLGAGWSLKVFMDGRATIAERDTTIRSLEADAQRLGARTGLLQARVHLARALMALDGQNFGTCNEQLASAARLLSGLDAAQAGLDSAALGSVQERVGRAKVDVGVDVTAQRVDLIGLTLAVDQLIER